MRQYRPHLRVSTSALPVVMAIISACSPGLAQSDARLGTVYYQVLYTDKRLSDLPRVPDTSKGIRSVLRIARIGTANSGARGSEILSTERRPLRRTGADRTYRTQLAWNGRAWVGSAADRTRELAEVISTTDIRVGAARALRAGRPHPLLQSLRELQNRRAFWRLAAVDIQAKMFEHAGTPAAGKRRWDLAAVRAAERKIDRAIDQHKRALAKLRREGKLRGGAKLSDGGRAKILRPTGKVVAAEPGPKWTSAAGIVSAIDEVHVLPHRMQVWAAPPERGRRTYHVAMAHAEAGTFGAFYYVAYGDSTGDGLPDTPIARSPLARSDRPGRWTSWQFTTDAQRVFIGHAWPNVDNAVYCRRATGANWRKLSREVYVAPVFGSLPRLPAGPYVSNFRVYSVHAPAEPATRPATKPAALRSRPRAPRTVPLTSAHQAPWRGIQGCEHPRAAGTARRNG